MEQNGWFRLEKDKLPSSKTRTGSRPSASPKPRYYCTHLEEIGSKPALPLSSTFEPFVQQPPAVDEIIPIESNIEAAELTAKTEAIESESSAELKEVAGISSELEYSSEEDALTAATDTETANLSAKSLEDMNCTHSSKAESQKPHSQTVGPRGPVLLQDGVLHEVLDTFVHKKIPQRAVHAKGYGAAGTFCAYRSMQEYTKLCFLQKEGCETPVRVRFSLAVSNPGTPDTSRNVRGFSAKFYTDEGVFDLLCNHIPVFLVRDAIRFPESIQAFLPSPENNLIDPNHFWNFIARAPEAIHFVTWLYSDAGTVKSLRKLHTSSVNTYVWKNFADERRYVKYHWIPVAGEEYIGKEEATRLAGLDSDYAGRELYNTIAQGIPVEYELHVQLMDPRDEAELPYDPLDDTKTWDETKYPLIPVGRLSLTQNTTDYDAQVERIAFSPANLLEGAELSHDKMLQGRSFIYWDAQRYRLGSQFRSLPVNAQKDWCPNDIITNGNGIEVIGNQIRSVIPKQNDFYQAGERYRSLSEEQKDHLVDNIASELHLAPIETIRIVMDYFRNASEAMAQRIEKRMEDYRVQ